MTTVIMLSEISQMKSISEEVTNKLAAISSLSREGIEEIRNLIYSLDRRDMN
jgi:signal transduction histidine kinase